MTPESLLIYYGYPGLINGSQELDQAIGHFRGYRWIVLGDGLQRMDHPQHRLTQELIAAFPDTEFFGYIDLGVYSAHTQVQNLSLEEIGQRAKAWKNLGARGVLLDDYGYDFANTRSRQNEAVQRLHDLGLACAANSWDPRHALCASPAPGNTKGKSTALGPGDFYLYESYLWQEGQFSTYKVWRAKTNTLQPLLKQSKVKVWAVTTAGPQDSFCSQAWQFLAQCAWLDGWSGLGWGEPHFSALDNLAPKRELPTFFGVAQGSHYVLGETRLGRSCSAGEVVLDFPQKAVQLSPRQPFWKKWLRR